MMGVTTSNPDRIKQGFSFHWWYLIVAVLAVALAGLLIFVTLQPVQVLPRMELAPGFTLIDQNGERVTSEDMRGKLTIYNFTYTHCGDGCPHTSTVMKDLQEALSEVDTRGIPVQFVTISFDPERDTPARLREYAAEVGADGTTWRLLSGDPTRLKNAIGGGFSTYYSQNEDGSFTFDPRFVLVDGNGIVRSHYRTATPDLSMMARHLEVVATEAANSSGPSKLAYEAAHLFLCYAQ
jgi:protein SCO1/2